MEETGGFNLINAHCAAGFLDVVLVDFIIGLAMIIIGGLEGLLMHIVPQEFLTWSSWTSGWPFEDWRV